MIILVNKLFLTANFKRDYFLLQNNILLRNVKIWLPWYNFLQQHHVILI